FGNARSGSQGEEAMTFTRLLVIVLSLLVLVACGGGGDGGNSPATPGATPPPTGGGSGGPSTGDHFALSVSPRQKTIAQGDSVLLSIEITSDDATGPQRPDNIKLDVTGSPLLVDETGSMAGLEDKIGYYFQSGGNGKSLLNIDVGANVAAGRYTLEVVDQAGSGVTIDSAAF